MKRKTVSFRTAAACFSLALLAATGCATSLSPGAAGIKEGVKEAMSGCKYLGEVTGTSKVGSEAALLYSTGQERARSDALEQAARLEGTHVVWRQLIESYPIIATCDVYLCIEPKK